MSNIFVVIKSIVIYFEIILNILSIPTNKYKQLRQDVSALWTSRKLNGIQGMGENGLELEGYYSAQVIQLIGYFKEIIVNNFYTSLFLCSTHSLGCFMEASKIFSFSCFTMNTKRRMVYRISNDRRKTFWFKRRNLHIWWGNFWCLAR